MCTIRCGRVLALSLVLAWAAGRAEDSVIDVHAEQVAGRVSRLLTGACIEDVNHEIYGGIYSQMIFGESFQEPPVSPPIAGFKSHGGLWIEHEGTMVIRGADGPKLVSEHAPFEEGRVGVELLFAERKGSNAGLIVRVSKPGTGADAFVGYEIALDAGQQTLRLARHAHNFKPIKDAPCEIALNTWIPLEVRLAGSSIEILVNGRSVLTHDDGAKALPAGTVGLRAWHREASFRNLFVKTGENVEPLAFKQTRDAVALSGMWRPLSAGTAKGSFALATEKPFVGVQAQSVSFDSGTGEWGLANQGLNHWGLNVVAQQPYEGYVWARVSTPTPLNVALESGDGADVYAETQLQFTSTDRQRLDFKLTPNAAATRGRFTLKLKQPGSITLGHVFLQPGDWGRYKGLPVRRDVAEGLLDQGITVLRYGGSMVNNAGYKWKQMLGPRDRRPPYAGTWYRYSSNGWGIVDFMDFCEAAGFDYIPDFHFGETPQDMADFVEYATGSENSPWGAKRVADGHRQPYRLKYIELGNEERVDESYAAHFEALAKAIWARNAKLILVVGDFAYNARIDDPFHITGAASRINTLAGQQRILKLARENNREVWFDVHLDTNGPGRSGSLQALPSFIDALEKVAEGARFKVAVFELNAGNPSMRRALGNALALGAIQRDGRVPVCTSANGLQPDGQNDNGWDQGLLFLDPSKVWLQPPGYVTQMLARNYLPNRVKCEVSGGNNSLDATATRSDDGKTLVLQVVNPSDQPVAAHIRLTGFASEKTKAQATELSGPLEARNTAANSTQCLPRQIEWTHTLKDGKANYTFPAQSFTVLRIE